MAKLPTKEELKKLYDKKGWEALTWYAWRNGLRALSGVGRLPLEEIWREKTLQHSVNICRVVITLANVPKLGKYAAAIAVARAAARATNTANFVVRDASRAVARAADAANARVKATSAASARASSVASINAQVYTPANEEAINSAASSDYTFLMKLDEPITKHWFSRTLWRRSKFLGFKSNKPNHFDRYCKQLTEELNALDLEFLAEDLNALWNGDPDPIKSHWENYSKDFSDENFKSAESLREVIFGESSEINAVRVLLLGPGGAGKSTLADRLQNRPLTKEAEKREATIGVEYLDHKPLDLETDNSAFSHLDVQIPDDLKLYLWDFGGQTLFHGLHKSFLHENCVYVLVVDSRHEQAPDEWLHQIYHLAGEHKTPPILIVSNEYENCHNQQNEQRLQREFNNENLRFFYFPCNKPYDEGLRGFKKALLEAADSARHVIAKRLLDAGNHLDTYFKQKAVVDLLELENEIKGYVNQKVGMNITISQLEGLGRLINLENAENNERYCLNPSWVIDHAYHLLYLDCLRSCDGTVERKILSREAWSYFSEQQKDKELNYPPLDTQNIPDLLRFLQKSRVCKTLKNNQLFFPDVSAANEPKQVKQKLQERKKLKTVVEFHLPYLPMGLSAHLVCRWLESDSSEVVGINGIEDVWREGFVLSHKAKTGTELIVQYQSRKAMLMVYCFGEKEALADLLEALWKGLVEEIKPIKPQQILPFMGMDRSLFDFNDMGRTALVQATQWLNDKNEIIGMLNKVESKMTQNVMNIGKVDGSQVSMGDGNQQVQVNYNESQEVSAENRDKLLLQAIEYIKKEKTLTGRQELQLAEIRVQVEEEQADETLYEKLGLHVGIAANVISVATALGKMLGL